MAWTKESAFEYAKEAKSAVFASLCTKAALTNLAKSLYLLDGDKGLIINTVHPGVVTSNWYPENPVRKIIVEEAKKADKLISPEAVAKTIFWLGTESPSSINGEVIRVAA